MFKLYKPSIDNKELLDKYLKYNSFPSCELSSANNILWAEYYDTYFTIIEDMLVYCHLEKGIIKKVSFPIGRDNHKAAFDKVLEYFQENSIPFSMNLVSEKMYSMIEEWYPDSFDIRYDRDDADYIYKRESLATLSGKKLHAKRNHINRFVEMYPDYIYENLNEENIKYCIEVAKEWENNRLDKLKYDENPVSDYYLDGVKYEINALFFALNNMNLLGLKGALIRVGKNVVAFTLGEELTKDTFVIHFEKAFADIQGAYAIINRDFAKNELSAYEYINREEDLGLEGLRKAKLSYRPERLVEKGVVTKK